MIVHEGNIMVSMEDKCDTCGRCFYCCPLQISFQEVSTQYGEPYTIIVKDCEEYIKYGD